MDEITLEKRVERIEKLLERIADIARQHPMGKMVIDLLGL